MTSFAGRWVVSRPGDIWSPRTFAPAGAPGVGMTSTARSWWVDVVGMAAFGRRRRLGAGGSATLRGSLSVDTLCLHGGRLPCYDNRKHGPERAGRERERDLGGGVNAECECPRWRVCDVLRSCGKRIATNCLESQSQRWRRRRLEDPSNSVGAISRSRAQQRVSERGEAGGEMGKQRTKALEDKWIFLSRERNERGAAGNEFEARRGGKVTGPSPSVFNGREFPCSWRPGSPLVFIPRRSAALCMKMAFPPQGHPKPKV